MGEAFQGVQAGEADRGLVRTELVGGLDVQLGDAFLAGVVLGGLLGALGQLLPAEGQQQRECGGDRRADGQAGADGLDPHLRPLHLIAHGRHRALQPGDCGPGDHSDQDHPDRDHPRPQRPHLPIRRRRRSRHFMLYAVASPQQHSGDQHRQAHRHRHQHRPPGSQDSPPRPGNQHQRDRQQDHSADRYQSDTQPSRRHTVESCPYTTTRVVPVDGHRGAAGVQRQRSDRTRAPVDRHERPAPGCLEDVQKL